jgi:hypothetical protein
MQLSADHLHELQQEQNRDPTNGSENVNTDHVPASLPVNIACTCGRFAEPGGC